MLPERPRAACQFLCLTCRAPVSVTGHVSACCPGCAREYGISDGIVQLDAAARVEDYPDEVYEALERVESEHFWFAARTALIVDTLRRALGSLDRRAVLDVGCGTGSVLAALERAGAATCGLDMHQTGLRYARPRVSAPLFRGAGVPFVAAFDAVLVCDVIEHVTRPEALLAEARAALKPDGVLLATVPAGPCLWSPIDQASGHKRRYTRRLLIDSLRAAGLNVESARHFGFGLLPFQWLRALWFRTTSNRRDGAVEIVRRSLEVPPWPFNAALGLMMALERQVPAAIALPGTSLIALARRQSP